MGEEETVAKKGRERKKLGDASDEDINKLNVIQLSSCSVLHSQENVTR